MTTYALPPTPSGVDEFAWAAAIGAIRGYCGWHIAPSVTETVTLDGSGGALLLLPSLRVEDVTAVDNDGTDVATTDFRWSTRGVLTGATWSGKWRSVQVTLKHGYDEFPAEVLAVARSLSTAPGIVAARLTSGPHSIEMNEAAQAGPGALGALHMQVLDRYRIPERP